MGKKYESSIIWPMYRGLKNDRTYGLQINGSMVYLADFMKVLEPLLVDYLPEKICSQCDGYGTVYKVNQGTNKHVCMLCNGTGVE